MKYKLGMYDCCADAHGKTVIDEMRSVISSTANAHSVVVCVYCDGYLQFAGGDACCSSAPIEMERRVVKQRAQMILQRFDPCGLVKKEDS